MCAETVIAWERLIDIWEKRLQKKYKNKMDGDTENKIINGNREDVKEKQEELKDNVHGVGRSRRPSFVWALFLDDEAWWRLDLMCGVTEHTSKAPPYWAPPTAVRIREDKILYSPCLVLFDSTGPG